MTLHINVPYGRNTHHMLEAIFKGFGRALSEAVAIDPRVHGIMSSKGACKNAAESSRGKGFP